MDNRLYSTAEAIFHVLEPAIESEIEDLDDSDEESEPMVAPRRIEDTATEYEEEVTGNDEDHNDLSATDVSQDEQQSVDNPLPSFSDHAFRWRSMPVPQNDSNIQSNNFRFPPDNMLK